MKRAKEIGRATTPGARLLEDHARRRALLQALKKDHKDGLLTGEAYHWLLAKVYALDQTGD
eukprot:7637727-Prorocentrum_lima.AAC.1